MTVITVGGRAGTGTTTLCRVLADRLDLEHVYAGQIFRDEAHRRGLSLAEFGALSQDDPRIDRALDDQQVERLRAGGVIMEGRLSGWLADHNDISATKVWLTCETKERHRRILDRDGGDLAGQIRATRIREASEADRYLRYYGADLDDVSIYDLVLDSTSTPPEALADQVEAALG